MKKHVVSEVWRMLLLCDPWTAAVCAYKVCSRLLGCVSVECNELRSAAVDMVVWLRELPYREYLATDYWRTRRTEWIALAGGACQLCNTNGVVLNVHHRTYERCGQERDSDVIVLCAKCHAIFHRKDVT